MQKLYISPTPTTPEIHFSPQENIFLIRGTSSPEDVRAMYYPVIKWVTEFIDETINKNLLPFTSEFPLKFQADLSYFNSSSAKFFYDIFSELKRLPPLGIPVIVEWFHDFEDFDLKDAGSDIALLVGMEFTYIPKHK
jgi:hypothetical protein